MAIQWKMVFSIVCFVIVVVIRVFLIPQLKIHTNRQHPNGTIHNHHHKRFQRRSTPESTTTRSQDTLNKIAINPLLNGEINLETIEGIEQVTKLVLMKTDTLPGESDDKIDARYLNGLMETLYTGLRKPFKSVSADILGIFPSFEEKQIHCESGNTINTNRGDSSSRLKRQMRNITSSGYLNKRDIISNNQLTQDTSSATITTMNYEEIQSSSVPFKSSLQVCKAVTSDCLSMEDLVQVLPNSINTFDKAVVRICPIMLFRIMNNICHPNRAGSPKPPIILEDAAGLDHGPSLSASSNSNSRGYERQVLQIKSHQNNNANSNIANDNASLFLNNLLREKQQILGSTPFGNLTAKRPQKLHKKSRTQTSYKGKWGVTSLQQQGTVDEQLQKVRLILTEPSIERVWIFSLMFVMISIVVSMGGLIVLPFVRKTTRRRILTLFEGLAVGGLAGSATLHMFPQAFGLVNEHYDKYFWRIFMVFAGIYLCYLCERMLKIFKVMRTKLRRSRASLNDMGQFGYGFSRITNVSSLAGRSKISANGNIENSGNQFKSRRSHSRRNTSHHKVHSAAQDDLENSINTNRVYNSLQPNTYNMDIYQNSQYLNDEFRGSNSEHNHDKCEANVKREVLIRCLQSVQDQFSRVYAVQTIDENMQQTKDGSKVSKTYVNVVGPKANPKKRYQVKIFWKKLFDKSKSDRRKTVIRKTYKRRDHENMIHHHHQSPTPVTNINSSPIRRRPRDSSDVGRGYIQHRLSRVSNLATERHDQDNGARMSVDTVAWMIVFGDAVLNVIDGLSIGAAFERNILAGISISVAVMLEEVTHRLGTFAVLIRAGMSMKQSLLWTFLSACALFPGLVAGIMLSDATEDATPYIFCAAGGIFLYMALVDVMKEMNRSIENAMRKDIKSTLQIFALQNLGIILAVIFLSFLALYEEAMDFEEYQQKYKHLERNS